MQRDLKQVAELTDDEFLTLLPGTALQQSTVEGTSFSMDLLSETFHGDHSMVAVSMFEDQDGEMFVQDHQMIQQTHLLPNPFEIHSLFTINGSNTASHSITGPAILYRQEFLDIPFFKKAVLIFQYPL
jgi:hypothetical protein